MRSLNSTNFEARKCRIYPVLGIRPICWAGNIPNNISGKIYHLGEISEEFKGRKKFENGLSLIKYWLTHSHLGRCTSITILIYMYTPIASQKQSRCWIRRFYPMPMREQFTPILSDNLILQQMIISTFWMLPVSFRHTETSMELTETLYIH
jgi:hypothetical protein